MVASIATGSNHNSKHGPPEEQNRVLRILMRRLNFSKTFGANMIFMLNRAGWYSYIAIVTPVSDIRSLERTPEDLCMQLLILKLLYLLFTTKGTSEYFYTNDLRVLVDVFLRELIDLGEENESVFDSFCFRRYAISHIFYS